MAYQDAELIITELIDDINAKLKPHGYAVRLGIVGSLSRNMYSGRPCLLDSEGPPVVAFILNPIGDKEPAPVLTYATAYDEFMRNLRLALGSILYDKLALNALELEDGEY